MVDHGVFLNLPGLAKRTSCVTVLADGAEMPRGSPLRLPCVRKPSMCLLLPAVPRWQSQDQTASAKRKLPQSEVRRMLGNIQVLCVCVRVHACVHVCVRACVCVCVGQMLVPDVFPSGCLPCFQAEPGAHGWLGWMASMFQRSYLSQHWH